MSGPLAGLFGALLERDKRPQRVLDLHRRRQTRAHPARTVRQLLRRQPRPSHLRHQPRLVRVDAGHRAAVPRRESDYLRARTAVGDRQHRAAGAAQRVQPVVEVTPRRSHLQVQAQRIIELSQLDGRNPTDPPPQSLSRNRSDLLSLRLGVHRQTGGGGSQQHLKRIDRRGIAGDRRDGDDAAAKPRRVPKCERRSGVHRRGGQSFRCGGSGKRAVVSEEVDTARHRVSNR
jgi:hypothetical protein